MTYEEYKKRVKTEADNKSASSSFSTYEEYKKKKAEYQATGTIKPESKTSSVDYLKPYNDPVEDAFNAYGALSPKMIETLSSAVDILKQNKEKKAQDEYNAATEKYQAIPTNADFAQKNTYDQANKTGDAKYNSILKQYTDTGYKDIDYAYINKDENARQIQQINDIANGIAGSIDKSYRTEMNDDEIAVYNYIYNTEGREEANKYIDYLNNPLRSKDGQADNLNARQAQSLQEEVSSISKEHPVASSVGTILSSPLKIQGLAGQIADIASGGTLDPNAGYNRVSNINSAARETVSNMVESKFGKVGSAAYDIGMSIADNLYNVALGGFNSLGKWSEVVTLLNMSIGAAADSTIQAKQLGMSDGRAMNIGLIAGAVEYITEIMGYDALFNTDIYKQALDGTINAKEFAKYVLKNMGAEGSEEATSDILNLAANAIYDLITGERYNDIAMSVDQYKAGGMTDGEALAKAWTDFGINTAKDFGAGAVSGGLMAGGGATIGTVVGNIKNVNNAKKGEGRDALIETGLSYDKNSKAYKMAEANQGKDLTSLEALAQIKANKSQSKVEAKEADTLLKTTEVTNKIAEEILANQTALDKLGIEENDLKKLSVREARDLIKERMSARTNIKTQLESLASPNAKTNNVSQAINQDSIKASENGEFKPKSVLDYGVKEAIDMLGANGKETFNKMYDGSVDSANFYGGYMAYYNAGRSGRSSQSVKTKYTGYLNPQQRFDAYQAGLSDMAEDIRSDMKLKKVGFKNAQITINPESTKLSMEQPKLYGALSNFSGITGTRIEITPAVGSGQVNGSYSNGKIKIAYDTPMLMFQVAKHEITHRLQALAPEQYNRLKKYILSNYNTDILTEKLLSQGETNIARSEDEIVAYFTSEIIDNVDQFNKIVNDDFSLAEKMHSFLKEVIVDLKEALGIRTTEVEKLEKIERLWAKALREAKKADYIENSVAGNNATQYSVKPPVMGKELDQFISGLSAEARSTYELFNKIHEIGNDNRINMGNANPDDISTKYMRASEWNGLVKNNKEFAKVAKKLVDALPEDIRKNARFNSNATLTETPMEKEFKMKQSFAQRVVDALPNKVVTSKYELYGKTYELSDKAKIECVGGDEYRRALLEEVRSLYKEGKLRTLSLSSMTKDTWGTLGWIRSNQKTGASGDFTTLCPQMYFNKGCWYCYRRAALTSGADNANVGMNVWYTGEILRLDDATVDMLNKDGGLRIQSFGDWFDYYNSQLADVIADAEERGLQVKIITKEPSMVEAVAKLKEQGLGKNVYFNLSADFTIEKAGKADMKFYQPLNPERPFMNKDGQTWWKRALNIEEANEYRQKYAWVNTRIVATNMAEFLYGLQSPIVDVVTGYHGRTRSFERISSLTGETLLEVEPLGNSGMPAFKIVKGEWQIDPNQPGENPVQKALAEEILKRNLVSEYYKKTCCITGRCDTCEGKCGKFALDFKVKNATNRDKSSVSYWQKNMQSAVSNKVLDEMTDADMRYSIKGENANLTASDKKNLEKAKDLEKQGTSVEDIYYKTGWYKQSDNKWRSNLKLGDWELNPHGLKSYKQVRFDQELAEANESLATGKIDRSVYDRLVELSTNYAKEDLASGKLTAFLDAPKLFKAYPKLENVSVFFDDLGDDIGGYTDVNLNAIYINSGMIDVKMNRELARTLFHEIQHMIQSYEGFAEGADPMVVGMDGYLNAGGEIEARDVERRIFNNDYINRTNMPTRFSRKNSNGETLTKAQQEFFKNSKVRDSEGNLLVVYHGTDASFTVFDRTKTRANMDIQGNFFSPYKLDAEGYGSNVGTYYLNIVNPATEAEGYKALNKFKGQNNAGVKARDYLISQGFDGVNNGNEEYIAFNSNQIKRIDNLNPTASEDVRYSVKDVSKFKAPKGDAKSFIDAVNSLDGVQLEMDFSGKSEDIKTLVDNFKRDLIYNGGITFVGKTFNSAEELGLAGNVFRDPRYETVRYFFLDDNNKVIMNTGFTSQIPNRSALIKSDDDTTEGATKALNELFKRAMDSGATSFYMMHNHPSGKPDPSTSDFLTTTWVKEEAEKVGLNLNAHIIIDHNKFFEFNVDTKEVEVINDKEHSIPGGNSEMVISDTVVNSPTSVAAYVRDLYADKNSVIALYANRKLEVTGAQQVPSNLFSNYEKAKMTLHDEAIRFGASETFLVTNKDSRANESILKALYKNTVVKDVINVASDSYQAYSENKEERGYGNGGFMNVQNEVQERFSIKDSEGNKLSKAQQEFFKDSKVRDYSDNLQVVYHGTKAEFDEFKPQRRDKNIAAFFTTDYEYAADFGNVKACYLNLKNPLYLDPTDTIAEMRKQLLNNGVTDVTFCDSLQGIDENDSFGGDADEDDIDRERLLVADLFNVGGNLTDRIIAAGYDGVEYDAIYDAQYIENGDNTAYIAFNANDIKLTSNENPTASNNTRFSIKDSEGNKLSDKQAEYFKDSKVLDKDGNLRVMYHGTRNPGFNIFDTTIETNGNNIGSHFGTEVAAKDFATRDTEGELFKVYLNITNPYETYDWFAQDDAYPAAVAQSIAEEIGSKEADAILKEIEFLDPYYTDLFNDEDALNGDFYLRDENGKWDKDRYNKLYASVRKLLELAGYDGISYENDLEDEGAIDYIAFYPEQIKRVDNLNPTANEDIRYSVKDLGDEYVSSDGKTATFTDERIDREIENNYYGKSDGKERTRAYIGFINPADFVKATTTNYDQFVANEKSAGRMTELDTDRLTKQTQTPFLKVEFSNIDDEMAYVVGHEGRHRMQALADAGYTRVAVIIDDYDRRYLTGKSSIESLFIRGQEYNGGRGKDIIVKDVTPLFEENRPYIKEHFGNSGDIRYSIKGEIKTSNELRSLRNQLEQTRMEFASYKEATRLKEIRQEEARIERLNKKQLKEKIIKHTSNLESKLKDNTDKRHIPEELKPLVSKLLTSINQESTFDYADETRTKKVKKGEGVPTKRTEAFREFQAKYLKVANQETSLIIDPYLNDMLEEIIGFGNTPLSNLSHDQLTTVWNAVKSVEATVFNANDLFRLGKAESIRDLATRLRDDNTGKNERKQFNQNNAIGGFGDWIGSRVQVGMLTPQAIFHRLGNTGDEIFKSLRAAQDDYIRIIETITKDTASMFDKIDIDSLEKDVKTYKIKNGTISLSTAQVMSLYELYKRPQAKKHIFEGGIKAGEIRSTKGIYNPNRVIPQQVTLDDIVKIVNSLSDTNKLLADKMQKYMANDLGTIGNDVSLEVYGYKKFTEKEYFPISVDKEQVKVDPSKGQNNPTIAGLGLTKPLVQNANNAVIINSIFDVFAKHSNEMAYYGAWLPTTEDLKRLLNYRYFDNGSFQSVKNMISSVLGKYAVGYISDLQDDINRASAKIKSYGFSDKLISNYKVSSVAGNLRVVVQQPTAILRAASEIDSKYLFKGISQKGNWNEVKEWCPIAVWKDWGNFDISTGKELRDIILDTPDKLDALKQKLMEPAGEADAFAWSRLWNAVKLETEDLHPELKGEAFYKHCAERFNDIIDKTQVVDGILQRSAMMRSKNPLDKMSTSFMSEPTKVFNMAINAIYDYANSNDKTKAKKKLILAAYSLTMSFAVNALVQSIIDAMRKDDKDKDYLDKFMTAYMENFGSNFNPISYIPYLKDLVSIAQGYDVTRMDMETIEKVYKAGSNFIKSASGEGKYTFGNATLNLVSELARIKGVPVANIKRDITSILNTASGADPVVEYQVMKIFYNIKSDSAKSMYYDMLYKAYKNNKEAYYIIRRDMIKNGFKDANIQSSIKIRKAKEKE